MVRVSPPNTFRLLAPLLLVLMLAAPVRAALEHQFLYFPDPKLVATPAFFKLRYEDAHFNAADGTPLHGWLIPAAPEAPLVLFCMGNAGNMSHRLHNLKQLHDLGLSVFIYDYRGYGQSEGKAHEQGTYEDIRGALAWLKRQNYAPDRMIYFGRSLGAAIALQAALEQPPAGLIMESPFTSIEAMGSTHYPLLFTLLGWLFNAEYNNLEKIGSLEVPLMILHGRKDWICPPEMAEALYREAEEPKRLIWLEDAGHNDTIDRGGAHYWKSWGDFLMSLKGIPERLPGIAGAP